MAGRKTKKKTLLENDGALCVFFANAGQAERPALDTYDDLLHWAWNAELLRENDFQRLAEAARQRPEEAEDVVRRANALRIHLDAVLRAVAQRRSAAADDVTAVNAELAHAFAQRRLVPADGAAPFVLSYHRGDDLDGVLWPVLVSASEVLTGDKRLGVCAADNCRLLFLDKRKGRQRRRLWCSRTCNTRFHAREYYQTVVRPSQQAVREKNRRERELFWSRPRNETADSEPDS